MVPVYSAEASQLWSFRFPIFVKLATHYLSYNKNILYETAYGKTRPVSLKNNFTKFTSNLWKTLSIYSYEKPLSQYFHEKSSV